MKKIQAIITERDNKLTRLEDLFLNNKLDEISMINARKEMTRDNIDFDRDALEGPDRDNSFDSIDSDEGLLNKTLLSNSNSNSNSDTTLFSRISPKFYFLF